MSTTKYKEKYIKYMLEPHKPHKPHLSILKINIKKIPKTTNKNTKDICEIKNLILDCLFSPTMEEKSTIMNRHAKILKILKEIKSRNNL